MGMLTLDVFKERLELYGKASKEYDPKASVELLSLAAKYYELPATILR